MDKLCALLGDELELVVNEMGMGVEVLVVEWEFEWILEIEKGCGGGELEDEGDPGLDSVIK